MSVYGVHTGAVLAQVAVPDKGQELAAAKAALAQVDLAGRVVAGDALLTQREVGEQLVAAGGDDLLPVKENQPTLCDDLARAFPPSLRRAAAGTGS